MDILVNVAVNGGGLAISQHAHNFNFLREDNA